MNKKIIIRILIVIVGFVVLYNILWCSVYFFKFKPYAENIGYNEQYQDYIKRDGDYAYSVGMPKYLSFTGNLAITQVRNCKENGEPVDGYCCDLIIWPSISDSTEYGIQLSLYKNGNCDFSSEILLDNNMNPIKELSDEEQKAIEENSDIIKELYIKAKEMWPSLDIELIE